MVKHILGQSGIIRYKELISQLFNKLTGISFSELAREKSNKPLFSECESLQSIRNKIIHQGSTCSENEAYLGKLVSEEVYKIIVFPVLGAIGLTVIEQGLIIETSK